MGPVRRCFSTASYWWARGREQADERMRFLSDFLVLEILANKLAPQAYAATRVGVRASSGESVDAPVDVVVPLKELRVAGRFRLVAAYLDPDSWERDTAAFMQLKKSRDEVAHGKWPLDRTVPHQQARSLVDKYMALALQVPT